MNKQSDSIRANLPVAHVNQRRTPPRLRGRQNCPGWTSSLIGQKKFFFFWRISEFEHFWNCFGKKKFPGALPARKISLARKYRMVPASSPWVSEDGNLQTLFRVVWNSSEGSGDIRRSLHLFRRSQYAIVVVLFPLPLHLNCTDVLANQNIEICILILGQIPRAPNEEVWN